MEKTERVELRKEAVRLTGGELLTLLTEGEVEDDGFVVYVRDEDWLPVVAELSENA